MLYLLRKIKQLFDGMIIAGVQADVLRAWGRVRKACREGLEMEPGGPGPGFTRSCLLGSGLGT